MLIKKLFYPILNNQATHNKHSVQVFIFRLKRISSINFAERVFCDSKIQISHFFLLLLLFFQLMSKKILHPWNVVILILTLQCSYFQAPGFSQIWNIALLFTDWFWKHLQLFRKYIRSCIIENNFMVLKIIRGCM